MKLRRARAHTDRAAETQQKGIVVVGRDMDWSEDTQTDLWALPRGIERNGMTTGDTVRWKARYGSVVASMYGAMTTSLQFLLDSFATVADLVAWTSRSGVQICPSLPGSGGKPGTTAAADRFVRAAYYTARLPSTDEARLAIAFVMSVIRNASAPFGTADPAHPNVSTTRWRTVADLTHRVYFFESTVSPIVIWLRLDDLDLGERAKVRKLDLMDHPDRVGDVTRSFRPARPFGFLAPGGTAS